MNGTKSRIESSTIWAAATTIIMGLIGMAAALWPEVVDEETEKALQVHVPEIIIAGITMIAGFVAWRGRTRATKQIKMILLLLCVLPMLAGCGHRPYLPARFDTAVKTRIRELSVTIEQCDPACQHYCDVLALDLEFLANLVEGAKGVDTTEGGDEE